jgi:DNA helicase-4
VEGDLIDLQENINAATDNEQFLTSSERASFEADIDALREDLEAIRLNMQLNQVSDEDEQRVETIHSDIQAAIDRLSEYNEKFVKHRISTVEDDLIDLQENINAATDNEQFLTSSERASFEADIDALREDLEAIRLNMQLNQVSDEDEQRVETIHSDIQAAIDQLSEYNEEFVKQQMDAHESLFSDIDDRGNDLTEEQCRAVIRNDDANQVVASAGTGKTLTLTYRIAYLIEQGIAPGQIAAITFTNKAVEEIKNRLDNRFDITGIDISTIHSFARRIAHDAGETDYNIIEEKEKEYIIENELRLAIKKSSSKLANHYRQFLTFYNDSVVIPDHYESREEYISARDDGLYETLADEKVASRAEKVIGDFLFTNGITYQYEPIADWADTAPEKQSYRPDFYLPEHNCYIEHWGIDENGEVASWFSWSSEEYQKKLKWARKQFAQSNYDLIETYEFEQQSGQLKQALDHRLRTHSVSLKPMSTDDLVEYVLEHDQEQKIISNLKNFIDTVKTFNIPSDEVQARLPRGNPRLRHFGECGVYLLDRYQKRLNERRGWDFNDMLYNAIKALESNPDQLSDRHEHILVDEFQDVAIGQIRMLQQLAEGEQGARLFCVGDDWQSIYAFSGAVVQYFIEFDDYLGPGTQTLLTRNFRCPAEIVNASTELIQKNPDQVTKEINGIVAGDGSLRVHPINGDSDNDTDTDWTYINRVGEYAVDLVERYINAGSSLDEIMVLSRYGSGAEYTDCLRDVLEDRGIACRGRDTDSPDRPDGCEEENETGVSVLTAHKAKGKEAKHVILLHAASDPSGFSPQSKSNEFVNIVRELPVHNTAEERRIFYVAMTRAEASLDILTQADKQSEFLHEISNHLTWVRSLADPGRVEERVTLKATVKKLWEDTHNKQSQVGLLEDPSGNKKFVAWKSVSPPTVRQGARYEFTNLKISEYKDNTELHFTNDTNVERIDSQTVSPD